MTPVNAAACELRNMKSNTNLTTKENKMKRDLKTSVMNARQDLCGKLRKLGRRAVQLEKPGGIEPWQRTLGELRKVAEPEEAEPEFEPPKFRIGQGGCRRIRRVLSGLCEPEKRVCNCRGKNGKLKNAYPSWLEARRVARERGAEERIRFNVYECPELCGVFHITSNQRQW